MDKNLINKLNEIASEELSSSKIKACIFCKTLDQIPRYLYKGKIICQRCWNDIIERGYISKVKELTS